MHAVVGLGTYFVHVGSPGCIIDAVTMVSRKIVKKGVKHFKNAVLVKFLRHGHQTPALCMGYVKV